MRNRLKQSLARQFFDQAWVLLQKERGRNRLRGRWVRDLNKLRIGLEYEASGDAVPHAMLWLTFGSTLHDCFFSLENQLFRASDAASIDEWVSIACRVARSRESYIRTRDDRADYK